MPDGQQDLRFSRAESNAQHVQAFPITSIWDIFALNQYAVYELFGASAGSFLWPLLLLMLAYAAFSAVRGLLRWLLYDIAYPKQKKPAKHSQ